MLEVLFLCAENDQATAQCPLFPGETEVRGLPDPAKATGTAEEIMAAFREVRDSLREQVAPLLKARLYRSRFSPVQRRQEILGVMEREQLNVAG